MNTNKILIALFCLLAIACKGNKTERLNVAQPETDTLRDYTENLIIYKPDYRTIELACGTMPSINDTGILFCAEAAYTGQCLKIFKHTNIAGDHVSSGKRYRGYKCKRNTGAFVYYKGNYKFVWDDYSKALDEAARNSGMGFAQEMMIHNGKRMKTIRKDSNENEFRALCELKGKLCVIDSNGNVAFDKFIKDLQNIGVTEALYLDMGAGWNYSWWRDSKGKVRKIHSKRIKYTTNWIVFRK